MKSFNTNGQDASKLKDFEKFLEVYGDQIVEKWIDYIVYQKDVSFEKITKRLK